MRTHPHEDSRHRQVCTCNTNTQPSFPERVLRRFELFLENVSLGWVFAKTVRFRASEGEEQCHLLLRVPTAAINAWKYTISIYYMLLCLTALSDSFSSFRCKHVKNYWTAENSCIGSQNALILNQWKQARTSHAVLLLELSRWTAVSCINGSQKYHLWLIINVVINIIRLVILSN